MAAAATSYDYDLITIGAGSGGVRASRMAASAGKRVAMVEKSRIGGTCVIRGCVPKKLLIYGASFSDAFADSAGYGWSEAAHSLDWSKLIAAKNAEIDRLENVYRGIADKNNVDLIEGHARLADAHTVEVEGKTYTAETILIATGSWPHLPDVPGIEHAVTSNEALEMTELPRRIVVVGAGYIGVEFAGIFRMAGAEVTMIIRGDNILRGFDQDVRTALAEEMDNRGIRIMRQTRIACIEKNTDGSLRLSLSSKEDLEADMVMYATGRRPNTDGLGLEEIGVELDPAGRVAVDMHYRSSIDNIFALGDVANDHNLTPVAIAEGMAFYKTQFLGEETVLDYRNIPTAVFSTPPVGTVGLTEAEARAEYGQVDIYRSRFRPMKNILAGRNERAMMKLIVDPKTDRVLGAHMVGPDAGEIIQGLGIAVKMGATKADFDSTIAVHPTSAEEFVLMREKVPEEFTPQLKAAAN